MVEKFTWDGSVWSDDGTIISETVAGGFRGMDVDSAGNLFVTGTTGTDAVYKYAPDGTLLATVGESGTEAGQFLYPRDVIADSSGRLYVLDTDAGRVQEFSPVPAATNNKAVIVAGGG